MSQIVEVKLWGTVIGHLGYEPGQTEVATFEYTEAFANSGVQVAPIQMKAPTRIHRFEDISHRTFKGLPGIVADSLPDRFGDQLIDIFMAQKKIQPEQITALDRLLYIGARGMGALEYHPAEQLTDDAQGLALDVHTLAAIAALVISKDSQRREQLFDAGSRAQALKLIRVGSSAGGARSKALISRSPEGIIKDGTVDHGADHRYWLLKFDSENNQDRDNTDPKGMTRVEYIYSMLSRDCGIDMPKTDYIIDGDDFHFLIERFDRIVQNNSLQKLHYASWCGINHAHRDTTGTYSYEQLVMTARMLGLGQAALTEIFRRAVFNVIGRNQDDHTKNFGFLMNKSGQWSLAPAFDVTYAFDPQGKWTRGHQITLWGKQTDFVRQDLITFGEYCNLTVRKSQTIIDTTLTVFEQFDAEAQAFGVSEELRNTVRDNLRLYLES
jgi:serine/threonine-protein kinase HipA